MGGPPVLASSALLLEHAENGSAQPPEKFKRGEAPIQNAQAKQDGRERQVGRIVIDRTEFLLHKAGGVHRFAHGGKSVGPIPGGENIVFGGLKDPANQSAVQRSEEHTSELQSLRHLVCRLL